MSSRPATCNTGRGTFRKGKGIMGLTRDFMYAGTMTTTVTLWSVDSVSAKGISAGMFFYLKQGLNAVKALREIKLQLLRGQYGENFRAPFITFGNGFFEVILSLPLQGQCLDQHHIKCYQHVGGKKRITLFDIRNQAGMRSVLVEVFQCKSLCNSLEFSIFRFWNLLIQGSVYIYRP
ncbi:hypothetical protein CSB45_02410 [candidate division KSB3 bacterium]|uniref:CHAT domain-containing protein n=1 Tax=candidate division KSB3 bacterium TaxID=2044937 RepID=A0A2G6EAK5_9BACT|nr:MAG: hypothetical protein CSB45_02410 [candidate division KSB3 bacterium]PIE30933.1 MAG: hypothetical protein CSA57_01020 [candidate division KSB3 bacterium]